jgi:hypothetical protein
MYTLGENSIPRYANMNYLETTDAKNIKGKI